VFGDSENVDSVVYMYHYLSIGLMRLARESYRTTGKLEGKKSYEYLKSFLYGAVEGITTMLRNKREEYSKSNAGVMALVKVTAEAVQTYGDRLGLGRVKARKAQDLDAKAYGRGVEAGKSFEVGKPIAGSTTKKTLK
jgi:hypothetical protein